jgi:adenylosuccinate lyase
MDKDILNRAMELSEQGLRIAQIARQLGVNRKVLQKEMAEFDGFEKVECVVIRLADESLSKTAYNTVHRILKEINAKITDPFTKLGDLSAAATVCYKIYRDENADGGEGDDNNNPIVQLFDDEIKLLKE